MEFVGPLSNHAHSERLRRLWRIVAGKGRSDVAANREAAIHGGYVNARPGSVTNAVVAVIADATSPLSPRETHRRVELLLGIPVRWSSIKQALSGNVVGKQRGRGCFRRIDRGLYVLAAELDSLRPPVRPLAQEHALAQLQRTHKRPFEGAIRMV